MANTEQLNKAKFSSRSGTLDYGTDFEYLIAAFYALRFTLHERVLDFRLSTNDKNAGDFDDVVIEVEFAEKRQIYFLQLKHKAGKDKNITHNALIGADGDFSLNKYQRAFTMIRENRQTFKVPWDNFIFILYTNGFLPDFVTYNKKQKIKVNELQFKNLNVIINKQDKCACENLINVSEAKDYFIFNFRNAAGESPLNEEFLRKFFFYTKQKAAKEIELCISQLLINTFQGCHSDVVTKYLSFFKYWCRRDYGCFRVTKEDIKLQLAEFMLDPYIPYFETSIFSKLDEDAQLLRGVISHFDVVIVDSSDGVEEKLWRIINERLPTESRNWYEITPLTIKELQERRTLKNAQRERFVVRNPKKNFLEMWHKNLVPLFIKAKSNSSRLIMAAVKLCEGTGRNFILVDGDFPRNDFPSKWSILQNLSDLKRCQGEFLKGLTVSLQGRTPVPLEEFVNNYTIPIEAFSTKQLLQAPGGTFLIGDDCKEYLAPNYITRRIRGVVLRGEVLQELEESFDCISAKNSSKSSHHLRRMPNGLVEWLGSSDSVEKLRKYKVDDDAVLISDSEFFNYFQNKLNVVCSDPGMGKSALLNYLKYQYPSTYWVLKIDLSEHIKYFREQFTKENCLEDFLKKESKNSLSEITIKALAKRKKLIFFWDSLDEIPHNYLPSVVEAINTIASDGYTQLIAARNHLRQFLEESFHCFSLSIQPLTEEDQTNYIYNRFRSSRVLLNEDNIEDQIKQVADSIQTSLRCSYFDYSRIPLLICMVVEIFLKDPQKYLKELQIVSLTDIYDEFIWGKFKYLFKKASGSDANHYMAKILEKLKRWRLGHYEVAALKATLDDETFEKLQLDGGSLLKWKDPLGIILDLSDEKKPVFTHKSYEEFLTAAWIVKNYEEYPEVMEIIRGDEYRNYLFMCDMILAKNCPVHLAVLYKNLPMLEKHQDEILTCRDGIGRTALELATSWIDKNLLEPTGLSFTGCSASEEYEQSLRILQYLKKHQTS